MSSRNLIPHAPVAHRPLQPWYLPLKSLIDFTVALLLLLLLSPVIVLAACLVKWTSPGPAFYAQTRVGRQGRLFRIYKLRSMRCDAESGTGAIWAKQNDDRVTPLGKLLRTTHIDEFPQLWNVVRGDMSLIGPRPERPEFVSRFELQIDHYADRLAVRPGITGIAQLRLPPDTDLNSVRDKLEFDLYYVRHIGPWLDFITFVATGWDFAVALIGGLIPESLCVPNQHLVRCDLGAVSASAKPVAAAPAHRHDGGSGSRAEMPVVETTSGMYPVL